MNSQLDSAKISLHAGILLPLHRKCFFMVKFELLLIGKNETNWLDAGFSEYCKRLERYASVEITILPGLKNAASLPIHEVKKKEGKNILQKIKISDFVVALDENGKSFSSPEFAKWISKQSRAIKFIIGGAFGLDEEVLKRADMKMSLSAMTFTHQMCRIIFIEQLYRAMTILKNEKYHH